MIDVGSYVRDCYGGLYKVIDVLSDRYVLFSVHGGVQTTLFHIVHKRFKKV